MPTTTKTARKNPAEALSTEDLIAKMDKLLPKWKAYNEDRKAKVPRDERRGQKEYKDFEACYAALRKSGLKLADARKQAVAKK